MTTRKKTPADIAALKEELVKAEGQLDAKDAQLAERDARIAELEAQLADLHLASMATAINPANQSSLDRCNGRELIQHYREEQRKKETK